MAAPSDSGGYSGMKKKTSKFIYVLLGLGVLLSIALIPFSMKRKQDFLAEGDAYLADFSVKMCAFGIICAVVLLGVFLLLLWRDQKIGAEQKLFEQELSKTPLFERWLRNEEEQCRNKLAASRRMLVFLSIPFAALLVIDTVVILDTVSGMTPFSAVGILFGFFAIGFVLWFTNYRKQYMRSLFRTVSEQLASAAEKEAFAGRLLSGRAGTFSYQSGPQGGKSKAWVTEEYAYFRQFRKCRIIRNRDMGKAVLKKEWFTLGLRPHFRRCYVLELSVNGTARLWRGYFGTQEELFYALKVLKSGGLSEEKVENRVNR